MPPQNIADRLIVSNMGQRARDPVVAPALILACESHDERFNVGSDSWPAWIGASLGAIEFRGHQFPIPSQNGVGFGDTRHVRQSLSSQPAADLGQRRTFGIGQPKSAGQVPSQDPILGGQILVLQQQFLIDQAGDVRKQTCPVVFLLHSNCTSCQICAAAHFLTIRAPSLSVPRMIPGLRCSFHYHLVETRRNSSLRPCAQTSDPG